jgi:hypothetical protein
VTAHVESSPVPNDNRGCGPEGSDPLHAPESTHPELQPSEQGTAAHSSQSESVQEVNEAHAGQHFPNGTSTEVSNAANSLTGLSLFSVWR